MSRILNVASGLLFIVGIIGFLHGLQILLLAGSVNEGLFGVTISQIRAFSPNLMNEITVLQQFEGLYLLGMALFFCVMSLMPYRKGEKWAWYSMLVIGGLALILQVILIYTGLAVMASYDLPAALVLVILWAIGTVLPAKEFFR